MTKRVMDLKSSEGNAWFLMSRALEWSEQLELDGKVITAEMRTGNYRHLCETFEEYFGDYATLINKPWEEEDDAVLHAFAS